ncbi:DBH-like monooxygenase protein 1 [Orchesella cincta]|uniref:DBH-like monooxygenase protein 1 n=1 Tax=Orchesella cincta TaxID=48709 RepID=A0A1D2NI83_ORCCI|nr:DBH-like monooxygenase protein 1 [Orchesella cincta]
MKILPYFPVLLLVVAAAADVIIDGILKNYSDKQFLDHKRRYQLEYLVDWEGKRVVFNVTVETIGWVGLGISKDGTMNNADIMIAGVTQEGKQYISDYHTDCNRNLKADAKQDWELLGASETSGRTILQISRQIDTCDPDDYPITEDLASIIWAYGETDAVKYHHDQRGRFRVHLLDPVVHPAPTSSILPKWRVTKKITVPAKETTYWCSIHKIPPGINRKHHLIEFHPVFDSQLSVDHARHYLLYRCDVPPNMDPRVIFEPLVTYPGEECYFNNNRRIPIQLCRNLIYGWAVGGQNVVLPGDVGIPFGESAYYMLEVSYDNPEEITGLTLEVGLEAIYTSKLRTFDGGAFFINYDLFGLFMVPPGSQNFDVYSHCDSRCTSEMIPAKGIDVFAVQGHSKRPGRKIKLRHYRNDYELPWIYKDFNFDWTFQTVRHLQTERKLLPGDHLSLNCVYDNTYTNVTSFSGFSSLNQMCLIVVYHKTEIPYYSCASQIPQEKLLNLVGVQNVTWDMITQRRIVTSPNGLSGKTLAQITDEDTTWFEQLRSAVATITYASPQTVACPITTPPNEPLETVVSLARGYGDQTLMGSTPVPIITPGPHSVSGFPYTNTQYNRVRNCPSPNN